MGGPAGRADILAMATALGADRVLRKPFTPHELFEAVRDLLPEA